MAPNSRDDCATRIAKAIWNAKATHQQASDAPFTLRQAAEAIRASGELGKPKRSGPPKSAMTEEEWLADLHAQPSLRGVDIMKEIGKCQFYFRSKGKPSRRRIENWLSKADATVQVSGDGKSSFDPKTKGRVSPVGWLAALNKRYPDSTLAKGGAFEITAETDYNWSQLDNAVKTAILREMGL